MAVAVPPIRAPAKGTNPLVIVAVIGGLLVMLAVGAALGYRDIDLWGTFGVPCLLMAATVPFILRAERRNPAGQAGLIGLGLVVKFMGGFMRYLMVFHLYENGDSIRYLKDGQKVAQSYWAGDRSLLSLLPSERGTAFIGELSGLVQTLFGQGAMGSFMFFAWLSFLGMWAFIAAARRAVPNVDMRRYAALVLFLPSMVFWPSSVGKDAWMVFTLGIFVLGAARVFTSARFGFILIVAGTAAMAMVRPHLALLALGAFGVAFLIRSRSRSMATKTAFPFRRAVGVIVLIFGFTFALSQASGVIPGFGPDGSIDLGTTLKATSTNSAEGASEINVTKPNSPQEYPLAFFTVMFRPTLFEASSLTSSLAALESTVLLVIAVVSRRRIVAGIRGAVREPYLLMAGLYTIAFAFAWSSLGNLGLIARQRVQVLPFLVLFLAIVPAATSTGRAPKPTTSLRADPSHP